MSQIDDNDCKDGWYNEEDNRILSGVESHYKRNGYFPAIYPNLIPGRVVIAYAPECGGQPELHVTSWENLRKLYAMARKAAMDYIQNPGREPIASTFDEEFKYTFMAMFDVMMEGSGN